MKNNHAHKLRTLFITSRPVSWINTAYPFAAGYLLTIRRVDLTFVIATLFYLIPYNLLMYGVNDVYDYESDLRNPRKGGIEGAKLSKDTHLMVLTSAYLFALPFVIYLLAVGTAHFYPQYLYGISLQPSKTTLQRAAIYRLIDFQ
jgi:4-hydroxybenzoate polyprenyltransferase